MNTSQEIRRNFLNYFKKNNHRVLPSSSVVPHEDPTLLFTNAGMNQFKDLFLGKNRYDYTRAATAQKCIRAGGKHNDLDNVGHTNRHLTFFEMLGNFSFGDYSKQQAIRYAWDVSTTIFQFDPLRIWPTVFEDDDEAFELWLEYVPANRISRFGKKDNFWMMGDTGPCGPCSELYYDKGPAYGTARSPVEDPEGHRYIEFWNLVFMQYNRNAQGILEPLPKLSIDTGAGLERVMSLKTHVESVFETDILKSLITHIEALCGKSYQSGQKDLAPAFCVIADHLRTLAFAIADGAQPSNVERGYVLRKILRRAVRYGKMLGFEAPFLAKILPNLLETMGEDYPELKIAHTRIADILTSEEENFFRTLRRGGNMLNQIIGRATKSDKLISGEEAFKLKDTYGLPLEEIILLAKDATLSVDLEQFQNLEKEARERSRGMQKNPKEEGKGNLLAEEAKKYQETTFLGYTKNTSEARVTAIYTKDTFVDCLHEGQEATIILDHTPFYAEMGGQVGDTGTLTNENLLFEIVDSQAPSKGIIGHIGKLIQGNLKVGDFVTAQITLERRNKIANNHTATHLLHWALQQVLGAHVKQAGSVVEPNRLRFDFSHHKAVTEEELNQVERLVNQKIRENKPVATYEIPYEQAQQQRDIKQFFGEKYNHIVRVVDIDFSKELCGGTHASYTGNIGLFRIVKEGSIAAGMHRIEAVTGEDAEKMIYLAERTIQDVATLLKTQPQNIKERIEKLLEENKQLSLNIRNLRMDHMLKLVDELVGKIELIHEIPYIFAELSLSTEEMRTCLNEVSSRAKSAVCLFANKEEDKCYLLSKVTEDLIQKGIKANELIAAIAPIIEGSGGGKPNLAQAGGKAPQKILAAFAIAKEWLSKK